MRTTEAKRIGWMIVLTGGTLLAGCSRSIHIQGVDDIRKQNVRVEVVGVNWVEKPQWETGSMQDYWSEGNQRRRDAVSQGYSLPLAFSPGSPCEITIRDKDPLWRNWKKRKATHFLVMFDTCSDAQSWRLSLPLSPKCWERSAGKTIEVTIQPSGAVPKVAPKAKCKG